MFVMKSTLAVASGLVSILLLACSSEVEEEVGSSEAAQTTSSCAAGQVASVACTVPRTQFTEFQNAYNVVGCAGCVATAPTAVGFAATVFAAGTCAGCADYLATRGMDLAAGVECRWRPCTRDPDPECNSHCETLGYASGVSDAAGCHCFWDEDHAFRAIATCSDGVTTSGACSVRTGKRCVKPGGSTIPSSPVYEWGATCAPPAPVTGGGHTCTSYETTYGMHRCGADGPNRDKIYSCSTGALVEDCVRSYNRGCRRISQLVGQQTQDACAADENPH
jgi:hypothetical protein